MFQRTYMTEVMPPKIFYINKNLEIGRCLVGEDPKDRWEFGQYKFSSKKSCEEWCRLNCCESSMENTIDKNIDFIKITKDDIPLMTKRILSLRNLDNYHECELEYVYRDWYNFRSEVKKFLTDNKVL